MMRGLGPLDFGHGLNLESAADKGLVIACNHGNVKATPAPRSTWRREIRVDVGLLISLFRITTC